MTWVDELLERVAQASRAELPALAQALGLARDAALLRLAAPALVSPLITAEAAAELVSMGERWVRSRARGKSWAHRIGGALRIDRDAFLREIRRHDEPGVGCSPRTLADRETLVSGPGHVHPRPKSAGLAR